MDIAFIALLLVVFLGLAFEYVNGFHDAANAIATSVSTGALRPRTAVAMAGILNFLGAVSGTAVAAAVGKGIVDPSVVTIYTVIAALLAAIVWDLITWWFGLPTSSSHALMFGIVGAGLATGGPSVLVMSGIQKILTGLVLSPLLGLVVGYLAMVLIYNVFQKMKRNDVNRLFRPGQILSAAFMAFSHGSNDGQKTMGIITMGLVTYYQLDDFKVPLWVMLSCALAMGLGTYAGGWKIIKTMGMKVVKLQPVQGFGAEVTAGSIIEAASRLGIPISTTHTISSSIMGVGSVQRLSAVRWGVAGNIVAAWVLTLPASAALGYLFTRVIEHVVP